MADVLKRSVRGNVVLLRNEVTFHDQEYVKSNQSFTESTHQRAVLATNMSTFDEIDLGGIATGAVAMLKTDRTIDFALNTTGNYITISDNGMFMSVCSYTHVYVRNNSTTYTATIDFVGTD